MHSLNFIGKRLIKQTIFSVFITAILPMTVQTQTGGNEIDHFPALQERGNAAIPDSSPTEIPNRFLIHGLPTAHY